MQNYGIGEQFQTTISAAGTTQATATLLSAPINEITTAAAGSGVVLSPVAFGYTVGIYNSGANPVKVYPPTGQQFNGLAANTGISLPANTYATFSYVYINRWFVNVSA